MMKLQNPTELVAHYKITTPMFLGGENQTTDNTQFRNASFKGALRFWWRALNWGAALKQAGNQAAAALSFLHKREGELFGLASDGNDSRQSCVQIHSELRGSGISKTNLPNHTYLLGMGLYNYKEGMLRDYLHGGSLVLRLIFKPKTKEEDIESVQQAAIALGLLGGLGSRSRKGFGSLALQKIELSGNKELSYTTEESIQMFVQGLDFSAHEDAPFSALTRATRIDISATKTSAMDALAVINTELQLYRSFGQNGKVGSVPARRNFISDHDNVLAATLGTPLQALPERAVFGLPHNYFFSSSKAKLDINVEDEARRASPLLIHIHALDDGKFIAMQTLLQSQFLPASTGVEAKKDRASPQKIANIDVDHGVISRYMDGFNNKKTLKAAQ